MKDDCIEDHLMIDKKEIPSMLRTKGIERTYQELFKEEVYQNYRKISRFRTSKLIDEMRVSV